MKKVLILGVNGFIDHHLSKRILETTDWEVYGMDMQTERLGDLVNHPRMHFLEGDIIINKEWVKYHVRKCDVIPPLMAVATPSTYVEGPLRVFELDFEANLPIIRSAAKYSKHLVSPSTSEVYGICSDPGFDSEALPLAYDPISKPCWIYVCLRQLMDRTIWGYGMEGLNFTLLRPLNWIGPGLDLIYTSKEGSSCVVTQFLGHIVRGENIKLADGGSQKCVFTYIDDGTDTLVHIIANENGVASGKTYNIDNLSNSYSVCELANMMLEQIVNIDEYEDTVKQVQLVKAIFGAYYGNGYQDVQNYVSKITNTMEDLGWKPTTVMKDALANIFEAYRTHVVEARSLVEGGNGNK